MEKYFNSSFFIFVMFCYCKEETYFTYELCDQKKAYAKTSSYIINQSKFISMTIKTDLLLSLIPKN